MQPDRRKWLSGTATGLAMGLASGAMTGTQQAAAQQSLPTQPTAGRIRQSVMGWCFKPMPAVELAQLGKQLGLVAIEGIEVAAYPKVKQLGLEISLVGSHGFATGPVDTAHHAQVEQALRKSIDIAVEVGSPNVITFTGMRVSGMSDDVAKQNCLDCWKRVISYAEQRKITLCLEHLNSRDNSHPMKGHPGYFGDDVDLCIELIKQMDSPNFRLLFDIYHVQIMHGDVIRRIRELHPWIAHYHTAGNPGRCEIDEHQEINYPPILAAILETGYSGFVAHEFIPTWDDPARALQHAIDLTRAV
jgi:hydroxypyruvate isomerase